jgi:Protein of unknown function (DUF3684)
MLSIMCYYILIVVSRMVGTGDWGIPDLIRYLVAVESSLTSTETDRLRQTVAFTKEEEENQPNGNSNASNPQEARPKKRYRAMDLYEPSSVLRELGLPIIGWGASPKWRSSSDEGYSLFYMLVKTFSEAFIQPNFCSTWDCDDILRWKICCH